MCRVHEFRGPDARPPQRGMLGLAHVHNLRTGADKGRRNVAYPDTRSWVGSGAERR